MTGKENSKLSDEIRGYLEMPKCEIQEKEYFEIDTLKKAIWATDIMYKAEQHIQAIETYAKEKIEEIKARVESSTKKDRETIEKMAMFLKPFVSKEIEGQKKRSIDLMYGKAGFRKSSKIIIEDEETAVRELEAKGIDDVINIMKTVSKTKIKELIDKGEIFDNIEIADNDNFYVDIKGE